MKRIAFLLVAVAIVAGVVVSAAPTSGPANEEAAPIFGVTIPPGYRDWKLISVAHEAGNLNNLRAILGNDVAIKAYREGKLPFPDGTIIAACLDVTSRRRKTTKSLAMPNLSLPGPPMNIQFMVKDSKKYAATGGWGFAQFKDGKPADEALHENLLSLPRACESERLCLHSLRTLIPGTNSLHVSRYLLTPKPPALRQQ